MMECDNYIRYRQDLRVNRYYIVDDDNFRL